MSAIETVIEALQLSQECTDAVMAHYSVHFEHFVDRDGTYTIICEIKQYGEEKLRRGLGKTLLEAIREATR